MEEGTPFRERDLKLPDEDTEYRMYEDTAAILGEYGFHQYEISNYAKPGRECRHNIGYWNRTDYLGIGLGASSLFAPKRWKMTSDLSDYLECGKNQGDFANLREEVQTLRVSERMEEFMFLGLRLTEGVSFVRFRQRFGKEMDTVYGKELQELAELGLLLRDESGVRLSRRGIDVSNAVFERFLL